jgi:hypothetical protein
MRTRGHPSIRLSGTAREVGEIKFGGPEEIPKGLDSSSLTKATSYVCLIAICTHTRIAALSRCRDREIHTPLGRHSQPDALIRRVYPLVVCWIVCCMHVLRDARNAHHIALHYIFCTPAAAISQPNQYSMRPWRVAIHRLHK